MAPKRRGPPGSWLIHANLTGNVRFLSEVPRRKAFEQAREIGAGALSIRALAVSRWRLLRTR